MDLKRKAALSAPVTLVPQTTFVSGSCITSWVATRITVEGGPWDLFCRKRLNFALKRPAQRKK